jgi:hypothetical protein
MQGIHVITAMQQALLPRVVMSYLWLQEGRVRDATDRAMRDVLALCPDHAEGRRNLAERSRVQLDCRS